MAKATPKPGDPGYVYINELIGIVNRESNTIRKWCREGKLPKRLMPKQGFRRWRYWTVEQVHGKNGILEWMVKNDMRPGRLVTDPAKADEHIANLRGPKFLNGHHINTAITMVNNGKTAEQIAKKIYPRTKYTSVDNCEKALRRYFDAQGWEFPPRPRKKPDPLLTEVQTRLRRAAA